MCAPREPPPAGVGITLCCLKRYRIRAARKTGSSGRVQTLKAWVCWLPVIGKLAQLDAAETLAFLASPPGNRLEPLIGDRNGQHSIRINDQWRVCFRWTEGGPEDVEIVDYH